WPYCRPRSRGLPEIIVRVWSGTCGRLLGSADADDDGSQPYPAAATPYAVARLRNFRRFTGLFMIGFPLLEVVSGLENLRPSTLAPDGSKADGKLATRLTAPANRFRQSDDAVYAQRQGGHVPRQSLELVVNLLIQRATRSNRFHAGDQVHVFRHDV